MTRKMTGQSKGWRLQSLTIRDFRGISGSCALDFACRPCLIHGDNGMGKSTIALALQWTIFGCFTSAAYNSCARGPALLIRSLAISFLASSSALRILSMSVAIASIASAFFSSVACACFSAWIRFSHFA